MLLASLFFAIMGASVKTVGANYNAIQIVFWRNVFGSIFIVASIIPRPLQNRGGMPVLLIFRGVAGTLALYALFYNLSTIGMGVAVTFLQTSPIFVAIFSHIFLKERLKPNAWIAIFMGFTGILCIFRPNATIDWTANILGLLNGILAAAAYTSVRGLRNHYEYRTIVLSFTLSGMGIPAISMLGGHVIPLHSYDYLITTFQWPQGYQWGWLLLVALSALGGQLFITKAYSYEKAGIMSAIGYMTIPMAILIGTLLGDPFPDLWKLSGIVLIILSGIMISVRSNR